MGIIRRMFYMDKARKAYEKENPSLAGITPEEMNAAVQDISLYQETHTVKQSDFPNIINYIKWKRKHPGKNVNNTPLEDIKKQIIRM